MHTALLIDDENSALQAVEILGDWQTFGVTRILKAKNGREALDLVKEASPDIIIVDMNMPIIDGAEFLHEASILHRQARYIVISGFDDFSYMRSAIRSKVTDYLLKPITKENLNRALSRAFEELKTTVNLLAGTKSPTLAKPRSSFAVRDIQPDIIKSIQLGDITLLKYAVNSFLDSLETTSFLTPEDAALKISELLLIFETAADDLQRVSGISCIEAIKQKKVSFINYQEYREVFLEISEQCFLALTAGTSATSKTNIYFVRDYINRNYHKDIKLEDLAYRFCLCREYLVRLFKEEFGRGIHEYLMNRRMDAARAMLKDNSLKIPVISESVGYKDTHYFSKSFKKHTGMTPAQFRKHVSSGAF